MSEDKKAHKNNNEAVVESGAPVKKVKEKRNWALADCKKFAGRFDSEAQWKEGSPSSYKAAAAHQWTKECLAHQKQRIAERQGGARKMPKSA